MKNIKCIGIPISKGIVIGKAKLIDFNSEIDKSMIQNNLDRETELNKFTQIINDLIIDSKRIAEKYRQKEKIRAIIEAEILFLEDIELKTKIEKIIKAGNSCLNAVEIFFSEYLALFHKQSNKLSRIKINDINFLKQKIIQKINNNVNEYSDLKNCIIISSLLNSNEIIKIYENGAIGFVTEFGSNLSHSSIISRSLNIPAVFSVSEISAKVKEGDKIIVDGNLGEIILNPDNSTLKKYKTKQKLNNEEFKTFKEYKDSEIINKKGQRLRFYSNINNLIDLENTLINNADGVGLVRTENLVNEVEEIFDEDLQFNIYNRITESLYPKQVTLRLFDFGYDKLNLNDEKEDNPALGLRGIRYLLKNEHILEIQLRAMIRASGNGNLKILIPMVSIVEEVIQVRKLAKEIASELEIYCPKIGVMIETPVAAYIADELCKKSDFLSVGTNDLMQYYFAADRNNILVQEYLNYSDKSFLSMLVKIRKQCNKNEKELVICGQIASDESSLRYLVKKGFTSFSVVPARVLQLKKMLLN